MKQRAAYDAHYMAYAIGGAHRLRTVDPWREILTGGKLEY